MKNLSKQLLLAALLLPTGLVSSATVADEWPVPGIGEINRYGASVPYTRYDTEDAQLGGGASMVSSYEVDPYAIASQGSNRNYIQLPNAGSYAEWTVYTPGDGVTVRFTLADSNDGMGTESNLNVYVNGQKTDIIYRGQSRSSLPISSYNMWQYFGFGDGSPSDTPNGKVGAFAFDENHFQLPTPLKVGDRIRIESTGGRDCGVDFIELEQVPAPIEPDGDYIDITAYGAGNGGNDVNAFIQALAAADNGPKCLYLPEGNYNFGSIVDVRCEGVKIMGAGIWHTNIMFTSANRQSGGFSGGNGYGNANNSKIDDYNTNMEFCHMYINSRLRSRYGENAVYKCFMDVWRGGSVIHDIWQEHFECGFWIGDYNGVIRNSSGLKIINCRIRNNFADGVNFCQSTSHSYVYNCNIRNCGDDGLAVWNATDQGGGMGKYDNDEIGDVFAYNTIDFVWRAGGIAIYGGDEHLIYNNYVRDMFMAAGIHVNDRYPGPKFQNTNKGIHFWNNVLVGCGTDHDCWNEDFAAVDIIGGVKNVYFHNTQIYDSPFYAIRVQQNVSNINFDNTLILGSGLAGRTVNWSCTEHSAAAIRLMSSANFNNTTIGNVAAPTVGRNDTWPVYTDNNADLAKDVLNSPNYTFIPADECNYEVVGYPEAEQTGGVIDPMEGVTGYNLTLSGLAWKDQNGSQTLYEGDTVEFLAEITNGNVEIPAGVAITLRIRIDDKVSLTHNSYKDGLKPNQKIILTPTAKWTATKGAHTVVATVDYNNKLSAETDENDNDRTKNFNVYPTGDTPQVSFTPVTGGYDIAVLSVGYVTADGTRNGPAEVGDPISFYAVVANIGDVDINPGEKLGVQFQLDGRDYSQGRIWWNDQYFGGLRAGQTIELTATGGGQNGRPNDTDNKWIVTGGTHTVMAWADDSNSFKSELDEDNGIQTAANNNKFTAEFTFPAYEPEYFPNPDAPDKVDDSISDPEIPELPSDPMAGIEGYNLQLYGLRWDKGAEATVKAVSIAEDDKNAPDLKAGDAVKFSIRIDNTSNVEIPAGVPIKARVVIDGKQSLYFPEYADGLKANEYFIVTTDADWTATAGKHTAVAELDYNRYFKADTDSDDNTRTKNFNVYVDETAGEPELTWTPVTGGSDLQVLDLKWRRPGKDAVAGHGPIELGDEVYWVAEVVNAGDTHTGVHKIGVQFQINNGTNEITWCDTHTTGLAPQERITLEANGGTAGTSSANGTYVIGNAARTFTVTAWVNDTHDTTNEVPSGSSDDANKHSVTMTVPYAGLNQSVEYFDNPDFPDLLLSVTAIETVEANEMPTQTVWYNLQGMRMDQAPTAPGIYIANGQKVLVK